MLGLGGHKFPRGHGHGPGQTPSNGRQENIRRRQAGVIADSRSPIEPLDKDRMRSSTDASTDSKRASASKSPACWILSLAWMTVS